MFDIKYIKLKFVIEMENDCRLPSFKASAIRGGMGNMLMQFNCISDGSCSSCYFTDSCIVQNIMYPKPLIQLPFLADGSKTAGYIIECFDKKEYYSAGDTLSFNLILFGKNIAYLNQFIFAFDSLGRVGLGKKGNTYRLIKVINEKGNPVFNGGFLYKQNIEIKTIEDYIVSRKAEINGLNGVKLKTPLRMVKGGRMTDGINFNDIIRSVSRRLAMLNSFDRRSIEPVEINEGDYRVDNRLRWVRNDRYSSTQNRKIAFMGVAGEINFLDSVDDYADYIIAGELIHIGKNTSFGYGKYLID